MIETPIGDVTTVELSEIAEARRILRAAADECRRLTAVNVRLTAEVNRLRELLEVDA